MGVPKKGASRFAVSENELETAISAAQGGDEMAFALLWRENNARLTKFVQARTFNSNLDFEEIVSETWLSVAKDIKKFKGEYSAFTAWLYGIARNRIIDAARKRDRTIRPQAELDEAFWLPSKQDVSTEIEADTNVKEIIAAINRLPEAQAEVVMLRVVSDLSVEEVAKIVKKNPNAVRVLAHRGLATLKEFLGGPNEQR